MLSKLSKDHTTKKGMLLSIYNGMPAPGGTYDDKTKVYCKKLAARAYFWPMKGFPVDKPIVEQLKARGCEKMVLVVVKDDGEADRYVVSLQTFLQGAKAIDWPARGDKRFPVRFYLPLNLWEKVDGKPAGGVAVA